LANKPAEPANARGRMVALAWTSGILGGLFLLYGIVNSAVSAYDAFGIMPGALTEGQSWGIYAVYIAIVLYLYALLPGLKLVQTSSGQLVIALIAIAAVVVPLAILFAPQHVSIYTFDAPLGTPLKCGSWFAPLSDKSQQFCAGLLEGASRDAITGMAAALALPLLLMSLSAHGDRQETAKRTEQDSSKAADEQ
jgi:hypothetical protein